MDRRVYNRCYLSDNLSLSVEADIALTERFVDFEVTVEGYGIQS